MAPKLTEEQRQALHQAGDAGLVQVVDPTTNEIYVLLRADLYDQMTGGADDFDPRETYPFVDQVMREDDADDPTLDGYQDLSRGSRA
jgi:hypothetical protein